jgi:hypothetical protein
VAPAELPTFRVVSKAYFADPVRALAGVGNSGPLGLGPAEPIVLLSPLVLAVATEVTRYLLAELVGPAVARGGSAAARTVRRLFGAGRDAQEQVTATEPVMELTAEQWAYVRRIVVEVVSRSTSSEGMAQLMGDAVVGVGHSRGRTDVQ